MVLLGENVDRGKLPGLGRQGLTPPPEAEQRNDAHAEEGEQRGFWNRNLESVLTSTRVYLITCSDQEEIRSFARKFGLISKGGAPGDAGSCQWW